jgi:hypothetical protein
MVYTQTNSLLSVVTWAKKEAEKSLKEKGISLEYTKTA